MSEQRVSDEQARIDAMQGDLYAKDLLDARARIAEQAREIERLKAEAGGKQVLFEIRGQSLQAALERERQERTAREEAERKLEEARKALRTAARELEYVYMVSTDGHPEMCASSEGRACVRLAERLLGPMAGWPDELNAQDIEDAAVRAAREEGQ